MLKHRICAAVRSLRWRPFSSLGEQVRAGLGELYIGAGFMSPQPSAGNSEFKAGSIFGRATAFLEQERTVEILDVDASILRARRR
jgi:hypothetical protein